MSFSILPAQNITGNYQIDSVSLVYTWFTRPMEQLGTDGQLHIAKLDTMRAGYDVIVHWPHGTEGTASKEWNFSLPVFRLPRWAVNLTCPTPLIKVHRAKGGSNAQA